MSGRTNTSTELMCLTCDVVTEYVDLANSFTQNLSTVLLEPMCGSIRTMTATCW